MFAINSGSLSAFSTSARSKLDDVDEMKKRCDKLEKTVNLLLQFAPEDVRKSIELALELDEKEDE